METKRARMTLGQIINMSVGFFGIQFGFALQNGQASRILEVYGADVENLSWFWLAAPLTGMIVQPLIGFYSDHTWTSLGRRRPFFLTGAILASVAMMFMPNAGSVMAYFAPLYFGAGILMIMDASFNIAMEPFRALVADLLPSDQRTLGFSIQTSLIGAGAVLGSVLPWVLTNWFKVSNETAANSVSSNVTLSFYIGAVVFLSAILWTIGTTKEFPPDDQSGGKVKFRFLEIFGDFQHVPKTMLQLGIVQFFSWFALFSMWVFTTNAVRSHVYGLPDEATNPELWENAGDWVGVIFSVYNLVAMFYALLLPAIALRFGRKNTHAFSLVAGGIGLISIYFIHDPQMLIWPMIGVGIAWASILAMPYAILSTAIPANKMGIYMGIFNFFITLPQIVNGVIGGPIVKHLYGSQSIFALVMAGVFLILGAFAVRYVQDKEDPIHQR